MKMLGYRAHSARESRSGLLFYKVVRYRSA
jgi:hypothetical protein